MTASARAMNPMNCNHQITESALDKGWRFEAIFHLGGMSVDESIPSALEDAISEETTEIAMAVGVSPSKADDIESEELFEHLRRKRMFGLLVQVATPVRRFEGDDDSCFTSWGYYST
uniref:hypothetical protein n=1 Tax=Ralstonia sp. ASV6 TaxID=2795124 RepID=UPI0018EBAF2C